MHVFMKTLVVTLALCIGYYVWALFHTNLGSESYSPNLKISKDAKTHVVQKESPKPKIPEEISREVSVSFLNKNSSIKTFVRQVDEKTLRNSIKELLKGPNEEEIAQGVYSEIPVGTKLIYIKDEDDKIIINFSKAFGEGGGSESVSSRLLQLVKTVNMYNSTKPIYLYIEGKTAQYLGGDGVYVEQPLNEKSLSGAKR